VASAKGGTGKTTTTLNLATFAANDGLHVVLVDLDTQATLWKWHKRRPADLPEIRMLRGTLPSVEQVLGELDRLEASGEGVDLVIIDTPPVVDCWPAEIGQVIERADFVLVPTLQGFGDLESVGEWMRFLRREKAKAAFLLNATNRQAGSFTKARSALLKAGQVCPIDIRRLEDIQTVLALGCGVVELKGAKGTEDLRGLWDHIRHTLELVD